MSGPPPPPPPPHGEAPKTTAGGGSGLPPGKYDVFIIPDHSAGAGFLYLPSLRTNTNSFIAGFASALLAVVLGQTLAPAFKTWWANFQGMGNAGMALLVIAVGLGAWSLGRLTSDSPGRGDGGWGGGGFYSGGPSMPGGGTGSTGGFSGAGPGAHGAHHGSPPPNAGPPPGAHSPPPSGGPNPGTNNPEGSYERPPEPSPKTQQTKPKPQAEPSKKTWEKAREEVRKKEEERKAKEAEDKRRAEAAQRLKELREKEARERAQREVERARREQEAREKAAKEQEARDKEAREKEAKDRKEKEFREAREKELKERLARDREERRKRVEEAERKRKEEEAERKRREEQAEAIRREEIAEKIRREEAAERKRREEAAEKKRREEAAEKKRREEAAEKKRREEEEVLLARKSSTYAFSGVGEKLNPWPNGKPPSVAPSAAPSAARSSVSTPPPSAKNPPPAASSIGDDADAYSYRPYDQPKRPARRTSNSDMSESSWAPSQSTARTTPPPSMRSAYATKDPDKIVIKGVYCFMNQYAKTPASQLISGLGTVTDGLILRITTEGLFIDDDVRGVAQREWDVKAWTLKLVEVWCPMHFLFGAIAANSPLSPNGSKSTKSASSASISTSFFAKMTGGSARLSAAERGTPKAMTDDAADDYLTDMLRSCKDSCRLGDCASRFAISNLPNDPANDNDDGTSVTSGSTRVANRTVQTGDWKARGIHLLRATIRDQEGKRYLFVFGEEEGWKLALGLQRLRRGTQARALGVAALSGIETKTTLDMLGWG